jgi:hypothetical protein
MSPTGLDGKKWTQTSAKCIVQMRCLLCRYWEYHISLHRFYFRVLVPSLECLIQFRQLTYFREILCKNAIEAFVLAVLNSISSTMEPACLGQYTEYTEYTTGWMTGESGFDSRKGHRFFSSPLSQEQALWPTWSPLQWVPGVLSR